MNINIKSLIKIRFLRNILLVTLLGTACLPAFTHFIVYPLFSNCLIATTEQEAIRIANHIAHDLGIHKDPLTRALFQGTLYKKISHLQKTLQISKLRFFSPGGEILLSTDAVDIGQVNQYPYFQNILANGDSYSKTVLKTHLTAEGMISNRGFGN